MSDTTTDAVGAMFDRLSIQLDGLGASLDGLIARYEHAREIHDLKKKLQGFCDYIETKYRAYNDLLGELHRDESWYAYAEGYYEDTPFHIEVDGPAESVVLHGILREIESGLPNCDENTGYCYLSF